MDNAFTVDVAIETRGGNYAFGDLDARITALGGTPVLLALEGMPATTDEEPRWQSYVLAIAERYRGKVVGYVSSGALTRRMTRRAK